MLQVDIQKKLPAFTLDVSFTIESSILVLFGPSGCGKTTTLRCIAGLVKPDKGVIIHDGQTLFDARRGIFVPPRDRRVGYMFQEFALFPHMSVRENILYGIKRSSGKNTDLFQRLQLIMKIDHLMSRSVSRLSGGEKQRVALARALMAEPAILLLDEPLSSLDYETRLELQAELKKIQRIWNIPFVLVTHDPDEAREMADQMLYL